MPRKAREESPTKFYHVMMRGINKERICERKDEKIFLIEMMKQGIEEIDVEIAAYCIMDNHIHIAIKGELVDISKFFKKLNIKFAMRYNKIFDRVGHVFQDRYKSEVILNEGHLMQVIRYIHMNPVSAGMVSKVEDYNWSSYKTYMSKKSLLISTEIKTLILDILDDKNGLKEFHYKDENILFLDISEESDKVKKKIIEDIVIDYCIKKEISEVSQIKENQSNLGEVVKRLLDLKHFTHKEIAEKLKINRNLVHKISKDE